MGKCSEVCLGAKREVLERELALRQYFVGLPEDSCLNMKTPVAPLEDPPYTLSMTATITSQHSIEKVQSNCTLSSVEYLGSAKTSVQVTDRTLLSLGLLLLILNLTLTKPFPNICTLSPFYLELSLHPHPSCGHLHLWAGASGCRMGILMWLLWLLPNSGFPG